METSMELINRGSIVSCTTCFNQTIEGGVMAFDPTTKMLILKCAADSGQSKLNDVYVVNLELCSEVQIKKEVNTIPNAPPLLNIHRIATRKRNAVDEKRRLVLALTAGVTPEGQKLFMAISKTIGPQVTWQGMDILVFGDTFIRPPYRPENVSGGNERRVSYVKKLVESQWKDVTPPATQVGSAGDANAAPLNPAAAAASNNAVASNGATPSNAPPPPLQQPSTVAGGGGTGGGGGPANAAAVTNNPSSNNNNSNNNNQPTSGASAN